jgi:hypothetical protein
MIITKDRDDKNLDRRIEFPKLILEEENIGNQEVDQPTEKTLSSREILTFLFFCSFFIIAVYMQISIEDSYNMNSALKSAIESNDVNFIEITIEEDYTEFMKSFVEGLYKTEYYEGFATGKYDQHALPNLNTLMTPIRVT